MRWLLPPKSNSESGFTLIELIVVVVIIGILAAIAGPSWLGFVQQRRVNAVNDAILQAMEEAKNKAQKEKQPYSMGVSFFDGKPQIAVYPASLNADTTAFANSEAAIWGANKIGSGVNLRENDVLVATNLQGENSISETQGNAFPGSSKNIATIANSNREEPPQYRVTFDYTGVIGNSEDNTSDVHAGSIFIASTPKQPNPDTVNQNTPIRENGVRCVRLGTLIGGLQVGRNQGDCAQLLDEGITP